MKAPFIAGTLLVLANILALGGCETKDQSTVPPATAPVTSETSKPVVPTREADVAKNHGASATAVAEPDGPKPKPGDDVVVLDTSVGKIVLMFYPDKAPKHVANFKALVKKGFYDGTRFHRCIPGFMIQGGDPNSKDMSQASTWGSGGNVVNGKEHQIKAEFNDVKHERGVLSMARSNDPDSASSQFFIMHQANPSLDGQYSAFGRVVTGMGVVDEIVKTGADAGQSGAVSPDKAVVLKSAKLVKWPVN